jgi:hypothetical protein
MSIKFVIECDGFNCENSAEICDACAAEIKYAGYHEDPIEKGTHYCRECWPDVCREIEANRAW